MSGKPTQAAIKAAQWLKAGHGGPTQAAKRFGLSVSQAQRIARREGLSFPKGRPRLQ